MPKQKTTPRKVNFDDDIRLLTPEDARSATNMRFYSSKGADMFAGENIPSTEGITIIGKPDTESKCIGTIAHPEKNDLYSFMWNDEGNHFIFRFNTITNKTYIVLRSSVLNFSKTSFVNGFAVTGNSGDETLLYWTDNINQPRQLNVRKAELNMAGNYTNGYPNPITEEYIRWVKYQPFYAPTFQFKQDETVAYNNLLNGTFQFRYRWRHKDGQYTAYSRLSEIAVSDEVLRNNAFFKSNYYTYNAIDVTVKNGNADVDKIEVIFRNGNDGEWLLFKTLENDFGGSDQVIRFRNDDTYTIVNNEDALKNYDAVPLKAKATEYVASRAVLGNAVDGYDMLPQSTIDGAFSLGAWHELLLEGEGQSVTTVSSSGTTATETTGLEIQKDITATFDTSALTVASGDSIILSLVTDYLRESLTGTNLDKARYSWDFQWSAKAGDDFSDFVADLSTAFLNVEKGYTISSGSSTINKKIKCYFVGIGGGGDLEIGFRIVTDRTITTIETLKTTDRVMKVVKGVVGRPSLKSAAKHPFAIAYHDEAGRSVVMKPTNNSVYVPWYSERNRYEKGASNADIRIGYVPPVWARSYSILYGGNSSLNEFIQYTISSVHLDRNSEAKISNRNLYVFLNTLVGTLDKQTDSYTTSTNAVINYSFKEGDRLRIKKVPQYDLLGDAWLVDVDQYYDFKIIGFEYFPPSADENPAYNAVGNPKNTYGWALIVEDPEVDGFSYTTVDGDPDGTDNENLWYKTNTTNTYTVGALIEIYNPTKKVVSDVFYETPYYYQIGNAGQGNRYHGGTRPQNTPIAAKNVLSIDTNPSTIGVSFGRLDPTLYVGDVVKFNGTDAPAGTFTILKKYLSSDDAWYFELDGDLTGYTTSDIATVELADDYEYAGITVQVGDVWFKSRILKNGGLTSTGDRNTEILCIEDYYANDFFKSNSWDRGRAYMYSPYAKQQRRKATIWVSEPMFPEDNTNGLSAFNLSAGDLPFIDYDRSYGSIQLLKRGDERLYIYQENKVSFVMAGQAVLKQADDNTVSVITGEILQPTQTTYSGDFGICENPESHAQDGYGRHYFVDIKRGKVLRLSADGLTPISDYKVASFLDSKSKEYMAIINSGGLKIYGGYDREYEEYNVTFEAITYGNVIISDGEEELSSLRVSKITEDANTVFIEVGIEAAENIPTTNVVDPITFGDAIVEVVYLDSIASDNKVYVLPATFDKLVEEGTTTIGIEDDDNNTISATLTLETSTVEIKKTNDMLFTVSYEEVASIESTTLTFHEPSNSWCGYRSYTPTGGYGSINYQFFSYHNDGFWRHGTGSGYGNFYGIFYKPMVSVVLNQFPSLTKVFNAVSIEGNKAWNATLSTNLSSTALDYDEFVKRDDMYYAAIRGATSSGGSGHIIGIGNISTIVGNVVTVAGYKPMGIFVGDSVYKSGSNTVVGTITAINGSSITLSSVSGLSNGNFIYVIKNAIVEGDKSRGYYLLMDMESEANDTTFTELFAVNCDFDVSYNSATETSI